MKKPLERFYCAFGDRGIMFILFAFSVVVNAVLALNMELPSVNPDEIGVASVTAFYSGSDWSALMRPIGYYYGYIQALFYVPLFLIFRNPFALYKSMLVMNGVLVSFIPMIAYHLASKLGVHKVWQKTVIALCSGFYITYIAHSKFIWNEAITSLLPWFLIWLVFMTWDRKNKYTRFTFSVLTGFTCAVCYAAHSRLIAVVIALVMTILIVRIVFKEKILNLPAFFATAAISFFAEFFFRKLIQELVWGGNAASNTIESDSGRISGLFSADGLNRFFSTLFGHLYTFMTSTMGLGVIAIVVFVVIITRRISEWKDNRTKPADGVKIYQPVKHEYSLRFTVFGIYGFLAVGGSLLLSALYKFNSSQLGDIKDLAMFGRYTDSTAPLAIFLTLTFLFLYGIKLYHISWSAGLYAYICLSFALSTYPLIEQARSYRESPILGLMPWRLGENYTKPFTSLSFVIMSSIVFAVFALFAVFMLCTKNHVKQLMSVVCCSIFVYTTVFVGVSYLPMRAEENAVKTAPAQEVSQYFYNDSQSPLIVTYQTSSRTAALIQFLNLDTSVALVRKAKNIPESCIIIADSDTELPFRPEEYDIIGRTESFTVYAYGETAREYIRYKRTADNSGADELTHGGQDERPE